MATLDRPSSVRSAGPVVDMSHSPHARLRPVPLTAFCLEDTFWAPRLAINREVTLPAQLRQCEETGRIDNFRRAAGKKQGDFQGIYFNDSDVYKWAEAAAFSLATNPDPRLDADLDAVIAEIAAAQDADGYLDTYFTFERAPERFTNLRDLHEIYCAGHLIQAAVAHHRATGKTTLLEVATRLADCLDRTFGPDLRSGACGHEEAEMALVELYRETGQTRYLKLAHFFIEQRGRKPGLFGNSAYYQDHVPFIDQTEVTGHAVRQLYLTCGATDIVAETGDTAYRDALEALWRSFTQRRMYITGGAGSRYEGEAFGADYELPNDRAYTETCAAIASVMWNWRMLNLTGETRFADIMETALYNGMLSGLSLDGMRYFYQNPLADRGKHCRQEWFGCACCPPNIARMLASLPGYFASVSEEGVHLHLYAAGTATVSLPEGGTVGIRVESDYPWDGEVVVRIEEAPDAPFTLYLRVPNWCRDACVELNGTDIFPTMTLRGRAEIRRAWQAGDTVRLTLPMPIDRIVSHPHVLGNRGRVALRRGPLVYCLEQTDHPDADVWDIVLPDTAALTPEFVPDLLGGMTVLRGQAIAQGTEEWTRRLYRPKEILRAPSTRPVTITAIPYYAWANREPGPMQVWLPATS